MPRWVPGTIAAAVWAWFACPAPPAELLAPSGVVISATSFVVMVAAVCVLALARSDIRARRWPPPARRREILFISGAAVWLAPLSIFLNQNSEAMLPATIMAAGSVTYVALLGTRVESEEETGFFRAMRISVLLQLAVVGWLTGYLLAAAAILALATALLVARLLSVGVWQPQLGERTNRRALAAVMLALILCGLGLLRYLGGTAQLAWGRGRGRARPADYERRSDQARAKTKPSQPPPGDDPGSPTFADAYRGVILLEEVSSHVTLVPPLPSAGAGLLESSMVNPLSIPFFGAYWFFRPPDRRPPPNAFLVHGSPDLTTFRSTDRRPLEMEAHQNLGAHIPLACCSRMQLAISNADQFPGSVAIEMILVDTTTPGRPAQSLGTAPVLSSQVGKPVSETLTYAIPPSPAIRRFDEFTVRFTLAPVRRQRSAKIAIERFLLIPKGR